MRKSLALLPLSILTLAAAPAFAQEAPHVIFCMGKCFGVGDKGDRVPVTKGTQLAPGMHLETGPDSYAQVKLGRDTAFGVGERARVRFERGGDRDFVTLDQGRIRVLNVDVIGAPAARPVELHTVDGDFVLRNADLEVKSLPKAGAVTPPTLVKLNLGDVRLGDVTLTRDAVQGIVGGRILDRVIPIGDIALETPRREPAPAGPTAAAGKFASPPIIALPVIDLPALGSQPILTPIAVSPAIISPEFSKTTLASPTLATTTVLKTDPTLVYAQPIVPASTLILAQPVTTSTGTTSLNTIAREIQTSPTTTTTTTAPLTSTVTLQQPITTTTTSTTTFTLSPKLTTTFSR